LIDSRLRPDQVRIEAEPIDLQKITNTTSVNLNVIPPVGVSFPDGKVPSINALIKVKKKAAYGR